MEEIDMSCCLAALSSNRLQGASLMNTSKVCIRDIIDVLIFPSGYLDNTVDKLEYGNPESSVKGIVIAFVATQRVIEQALSLGANLVISHEGIFYSHWDRREMLRHDEVYRTKHKVIEDSGIAIFRFHDYIHKYKPDGITKGLMYEFGWQNYEVKNLPAASILEIPETPLEGIIAHVKNTLSLPYVRSMGDLSMPCRRIALLAGYRGGGDNVIPLFRDENPDLVIYGEGPEWETPEYVRDALHQGRHKALLVLGHAESEMPGMKLFARELQARFPGIPVIFLPQDPIFRIS